MILQYASNASKLHRKIGEVLQKTAPFCSSTIRQEVIVSSLFKGYSNNRDRYDYVIDDCHLVIEAHGIQHYSVNSFGSKAEDAVMNFKTQQFRDNQKMEIALLNGWSYLSIPYSDEKSIDSKYLLDLYMANINTQPLIEAVKVDTSKQDLYKEQQKEKARAYRKEQYQRMKEYKKQVSSHD